MLSPRVNGIANVRIRADYLPFCNSSENLATTSIIAKYLLLSQSGELSPGIFDRKHRRHVGERV